MTLKDLLNVAHFCEIIVKNEENKLNFNLDEEMLENMSNIFAQEFLNSEVGTVGPIDEFTLLITLEEKWNDI